MSKTNTNQKPFDVVMNEYFGKYQSKGFSRSWFIPIVKEQSLMDELISIQSKREDSWGVNWDLGNKFPNIQLEVNNDDEGNPTSIYVLYPKGGKLYRVVSQKDYGVIKSRMELKNGKYVPYEKCDLEPYNGVVELWDENRMVSSISYKNGIKDGECFKYYKSIKNIRDEETKEWRRTNHYEKTTFRNGKKNGEYENTHNGEKGNYINNQKNGKWKIKESTVYKEMYSSYESKFHQMNKYQLEDFIDTQFNKISKRSDSIIDVFYVNGVLNGEFETYRYKGEFQLGLPNGILSSISDYSRDEKTKTIYLDGLKKSEVSFELSDLDYDDGEHKYTITNYDLDGEIKDRINLSTELYNEIPNEFKTKTEEFLTEDIFYTIIKHQNNWLEQTLEEFLSKWVVTNVSNWVSETNEYNHKTSKRINWIDISKSKSNFLSIGNGWSNISLKDYLIEECGYPYYDEREIGDYHKKTIIDIKTSDEYDVYDLEDKLPYLFSLSQNGEPTKVYLNGEILDETINGETNPILINFEKEQYQLLSDKMKLSYEKELKLKEREKEIEEKLKQKEREENGLSLNSFPTD